MYEQDARAAIKRVMLMCFSNRKGTKEGIEENSYPNIAKTVEIYKTHRIHKGEMFLD